MIFLSIIFRFSKNSLWVNRLNIQFEVTSIGLGICDCRERVINKAKQQQEKKIETITKRRQWSEQYGSHNNNQGKINHSNHWWRRIFMNKNTTTTENSNFIECLLKLEKSMSFVPVYSYMFAYTCVCVCPSVYVCGKYRCARKQAILNDFKAVNLVQVFASVGLVEWQTKANWKLKTGDWCHPINVVAIHLVRL